MNNADIATISAAYRSWSGGLELPDPMPVASLDICEDDRTLVNRLFYIVPDVSSGKARYFSFFEDNVFSKDGSGDLVLRESVMQLG